MPKINWMGITREDVIKAIEIFLAENPKYPNSKSTFIIYNGEKLPAKHIRGMAYKVAYGKEISKNDFGGGMETVRFFERLGFEVLYTAKYVETNTVIKQKQLDQKAINKAEIAQSRPLKAEKQVLMEKLKSLQKA